jgi:hypothetical protein
MATKQEPLDQIADLEGQNQERQDQLDAIADPEKAGVGGSIPPLATMFVVCPAT